MEVEREGSLLPADESTRECVPMNVSMSGCSGVGRLLLSALMVLRARKAKLPWVSGFPFQR